LIAGGFEFARYDSERGGLEFEADEKIEKRNRAGFDQKVGIVSNSISLVRPSIANSASLKWEVERSTFSWHKRDIGRR